METYINSIEFFGCPGSGKSTISHMIADSIIKSNKISIKEPSYSLVHTNKKYVRILYKALNYLLFYIIHHKIYSKLYRILKTDCGFSFKEILYHMYNLAYKINIYLSKKKSIIYFWDEGLIQSIVSISVDEKIICKLNDFFEDKIINNCLKIYIDVEENEAIKRLKTRSIHGSRVEKEKNDQDRLTHLKQIRYCYKKLCNEHTIIYNSNNNDISSLVEKIYMKGKI